MKGGKSRNLSLRRTYINSTTWNVGALYKIIRTNTIALLQYYILFRCCYLRWSSYIRITKNIIFPQIQIISPTQLATYLIFHGW